MPRLRCASCGSQTRSTSFWIPASSSGSAHFPSWGSRAPRWRRQPGGALACSCNCGFSAGRATAWRSEREHLRFDPHVMMSMVRLSGSAVVQGLIPNLSWLGLVRILSTFGSDALAGFAIAFRVMVFAFLPAWGLANAAATLVGQNLGAGQPERAEASVWRACFYNMVFLGVVGLIFVVLPGPIVAAFTQR